MGDFALSILFGLMFGFLFGVGVALMSVHAAYRRGYCKSVADSLEPVKPKLFKQELEAIRKQRAVAAAKRAAELGIDYTPPEMEKEPEQLARPEPEQRNLPAPRE